MKRKATNCQMKIRITGGELRGREILSPGVDSTHPMGAREKLALFNMLTGEIAGARVLDAYAGSGALGIEALSRGADSVVFVEKSPKVAGIIRQNLQDLGLENTEVEVAAVENYAENKDTKFDLILADPPYDNFSLTGVEELTKVLKYGGILVLSHPGEAPELTGMELIKTKKYAGARISEYQKTTRS